MPKPKSEGTCALCGTEGKLCNSHILPELFYKKCFDGKGRMLSVYGSAVGSPSIMQSGVNMPLLCAECEVAMSKYETVVAGLMRRVATHHTLSYDIIELEGYPSESVRLFALSVLWKCAVSGKPEYKKVQLGSHQEKIRQILIEGQLGPPREYALILTKHSGSNVVENSVVPPVPCRFNGMFAYHMSAWGIEWLITVSNHFAPGPNELLDLYVGMRDKILVPVKPTTDLEFLNKFNISFLDETVRHADRLAEVLSRK